MIDVLYIAAFIAFFALMVAFVYWCDRIIGKNDASSIDAGDAGDAGYDDIDDGSTAEQPGPASTVKTPQEITS
jgi:hypothetical protein